jgi:hypothetical protein
MPQPETTTLQVNCAYCHGAVTVQLTGWNPGYPAVPASYYCPYCDKQNRMAVPGRLAWATKREDEPLPPQ